MVVFLRKTSLALEVLVHWLSCFSWFFVFHLHLQDQTNLGVTQTKHTELPGPC